MDTNGYEWIQVCIQVWIISEKDTMDKFIELDTQFRCFHVVPFPSISTLFTQPFSIAIGVNHAVDYYSIVLHLVASSSVESISRFLSFCTNSISYSWSLRGIFMCFSEFGGAVNTVSLKVYVVPFQLP